MIETKSYDIQNVREQVDEFIRFIPKNILFLVDLLKFTERDDFLNGYFDENGMINEYSAEEHINKFLVAFIEKMHEEDKNLEVRPYVSLQEQKIGIGIASYRVYGIEFNSKLDYLYWRLKTS